MSLAVVKERTFHSTLFCVVVVYLLPHLFVFRGLSVWAESRATGDRTGGARKCTP